MSILKNKVGYKKIILFHLLLNTLFALLITSSSYYHTPLNQFKDRLVYFMHLCILQSTFSGFLYILSLSRLAFKIVFPVTFIILGFLAFWTFCIDISVSSSLIKAAICSKLYIMKDLFSFQLALYLIVLAGAIVFILKFYNKIDHRKGFPVFLPISLVCILSFFYINNRSHRTLSSKLPYSFFYSLTDYSFSESLPLKKPQKVTNIPNSPDLKVVLIIGESVTASHLGINGYERLNTPLLSARSNLISFKNIYTSNGITIESVPQLLTDESVYQTEKDSVFDLYSQLNNINIPTTWIGNQLLESTYEPIVKNNNEVIIIDELKSFYSFHKKRDLELLPFLEDRLSLNTKGAFSLHMIGSHWWYEDKYTDEFRQYTPVVDSKYVPALTKNQVINSYDNTILYLDNFIDSTIKLLENTNEPTVLIYISDHGEALGEDGKWLHAHQSGVNNPAMVVWYSDLFKQKYPDKINALNSKGDQKLTTDVIYHSILDLFEIATFDKKESLFI